jgi:thiamine-monophosphate kinase
MSIVVGDRELSLVRDIDRVGALDRLPSIGSHGMDTWRGLAVAGASAGKVQPLRLRGDYDERVSWNEDDVHVWLSEQAPPRGLAGSRGHDAAVLAQIGGHPVVCVDQTIEGVHFESSAQAALIGRKAAARAISDLAATAASPRAVLLALAVPRTRGEAWIRGVIGGVRAMARAHGADLLGGDLSRAPSAAHVAVTAVGEYAGRGAPPGRDRARAGQRVWLTGPVGGSLLGRHLSIEPRVAVGSWLHRRGATAMMDVSDGLAWDLHRLARASRVRIDLDLARVPVHADAERRARSSGKSALWHALHDGEDHELIATLDARASEKLERESAREGVALFEIGAVRRGTGLHLLDERGRSRAWKKSEGGWAHGG